MVITMVGNKIMLIDNKLARIIEKDKVSIYANEGLAIQGKEPSMTYLKNEATRYVKLLLERMDLSGNKKDIDQLMEMVNG